MKKKLVIIGTGTASLASDPSSAASSMTYVLDDGPSAAGRRQWKVTLHTNRHDTGSCVTSVPS